MSDTSKSDPLNKPRPIRPDDLYRLKSVSDIALHPNGASAVYEVSWPDRVSDSNRSQLFSVDVDGGDRRQLTFGHRDWASNFSPDGTQLAFLRSTPGKPTCVVLLSWPVGEVVEVAAFIDGACRLDWLNNEQLIVTAAERPDKQQDMSDEEVARLPRIVTTIDYRFDGRGYINDRLQQLYVLDAEAGATPKALGKSGIDYGSLAISPDRSSIAVIAATDDDADLTGANHVWHYSVTGDDAPVRLTEVGGQWASLVWHPDGTLIATGQKDNSVTGFHKLHTIAVVGDGGQVRVEVTGDHDHHVSPSSLSGRGAVAVDGGLLLPGLRAGRIAIDRYDLATGDRAIVHDGPHQVLAFDASADQSVVLAAITTTERPAELWRIDGAENSPGNSTGNNAGNNAAGSNARKLVSLNDEVLAELDLATTETIYVESEPGVEVQAFVVRPPASAPNSGDPAPGLLYVHGGPMFQYGLCFFDEFQMAAACGYVVVAGNPRGSDGRGEQWATAIIGDLGNKDWVDVSALTDRLASLPEVDADRIGIGGGSYGGFMTGWALSHDKRFKAGLIERAVTSWESFYGTSDIGTWFTAKTIGSTVETNQEEVTRQSPLHYAADITAPTLIVHSEHDWRCPIEQGEQLFSALRRAGVAVTMVRFPEESHGLTRGGGPLHRVERFEIVHEFYAKHLGGAQFGTTHLGT